MNVHAPSEPMTPEALEEALRAIGPVRYHDLHPFHGLLHDGKLNKGQVQAWALNRFVYQSAIPRKDASLIARCEDRELRREWVHRITDHDGVGEEQGGIDRWLILTDGLGLDRDYVISQEGALPATKFAVEAYVRFVREKPLVEAVASSLTELFAPSLHKRRIAGMLANYSFIDEKVVAYFRRRLDQAPKDAQFALDYVKRNARTVEEQRGALAALEVQDRCIVGAARRPASRLCRRRDPSRGLQAGLKAMDEAKEIHAQSRPHLPRGVRLKRDEARGRWTLLAPERIFEIDDTAATVLELCDGERDLGAIVAELAARYTAPPAVIEKDVVAMLADLKAKRVLET